MNGIFNLNKPSGKSSHAIVATVRKFSGIQRVGHGGTLDPLATGVLLVCIGQAVRITEYLLDHDKKYRARVRLGIETDTYDAAGAVIFQRDVSVTRAEIERALKTFHGKISQRPPVYSAIKRDGVALYKRARRGEAVETDARAVEIFSLELNEVFNLAEAIPTSPNRLSVGAQAAENQKHQEIEFTVHCSKGTYIRSLAHDLGEKLGCGAHLSALTRLASGNFKLENSVTLDQLREAFEKRDAEKYLLPLDRALEQFDVITVDTATAKKIVNGLSIESAQKIATPLARVYADGKIIALVERESAPNVWKPKKVFG